MSEQDRTSPYNTINTITSTQVIKILKNVISGISCWSNTKLAKLTSKELHDRQQGELWIKEDLWVEIPVSCTSVQTELGLDM